MRFLVADFTHHFQEGALVPRFAVHDDAVHVENHCHFRATTAVWIHNMYEAGGYTPRSWVLKHFSGLNQQAIRRQRRYPQESIPSPNRRPTRPSPAPARSASRGPTTPEART